MANSSTMPDPEPPVTSGGYETPPMGPLGKRRYRRRLSSLRHVQTALADVARKLESGLMEPPTARAMIYALSSLAHVIRSADRAPREGTDLPSKGADAEGPVI
jgi:hypothetical protein